MTTQKTSPLEVATCNNVARVWSRAWRKFEIYSAIAELRTKNDTLNIGSLLQSVRDFEDFKSRNSEVETQKSDSEVGNGLPRPS